MNLEANIVVLYHAECLDGFGAAYAAWKKFGDEAIYIPVKYDNPPPVEAYTADELFLVDFSYKKEVLQELRETCPLIIVLDHHVTAEHELKDLFASGTIEGVFNMRCSGAVITWDYLFPTTEMPWLLKHVQDRDLWKFELPLTREIIAALWNEDRTFEKWDQICNDLMRYFPTLVDKGTTLLKEQANFVDTFVSKVVPIRYGDFHAALVNCPQKVQSDLGHLLTDASGSYDLAMMYTVLPEIILFSLRSSSATVDCSQIAYRFGGGGHPQAAGFSINSQNILSELIRALGAIPHG